MKVTAWTIGILAAVAASTSALADQRVMILPFNGLNLGANQQWIGKGVQENLAADLGRNGVDPVPYNTQVIIEDNVTAARIARGQNAPYVIRGSVQVVGNDLRITAQLIDVASGGTLRTGLVTGPADNLLKLEDQLAAQIRGADAQPATATAGAPAPATSTPMIISQQPQVIVVSQPEPIYPDYSYYPYYNSIFSPWYGGVFFPIILHPVNHGHDHDHDGDHCNDGDHGHDSGHGTGPLVRVTHNDFNPVGLPIPTGNVLLIPSGNVLPIPNNNVLPVPTNNVLPVPTRNVQPLPVRNVQPLVTNTVSPLPTRNSAPVPTSGTVPVITRTPLPTPSVQRSMPAPVVQRSSPARAPVAPAGAGRTRGRGGN